MSRWAYSAGRQATRYLLYDKRSSERQDLEAPMDLFVLKTWLQAKFNADGERGASMVEYGLLLGLIAIIALVAVQAFGSGVSSQFSTISSTIN
jgi:pilus assembly protein Flp/PilA